MTETILLILCTIAFLVAYLGTLLVLLAFEVPIRNWFDRVLLRRVR